MVTTKAICNFVLPGGTMLMPSECKNSEKPEESSDYKHLSIRLFDKKKQRPEYIDYYVRKSRDANHVLNLNDIAFDWFTGPDSYADAGYSKGEWKKLVAMQRLYAHLDAIAKDLRATSYTVEILPE